MEIGSKVRIKGFSKLQTLTRIGFRKNAPMQNGGIFHAEMFAYAGIEGVITEISIPAENNMLTAPAYKIGEFDIYWSPELFEVVK